AMRAPLHRSIYDAETAELAALLGARTVERRPFVYRSSAPIAELYADGRRLLLKDLSRTALTERTLPAKPAFLYDPRREIEVYGRLLAGAGLGTAELAAAVAEPERDRYWLVIENVDGAALSQ